MRSTFRDLGVGSSSLPRAEPKKAGFAPYDDHRLTTGGGSGVTPLDGDTRIWHVPFQETDTGNGRLGSLVIRIHDPSSTASRLEYSVADPVDLQYGLRISEIDTGTNSIVIEGDWSEEMVSPTTIAIEGADDGDNNADLISVVSCTYSTATNKSTIALGVGITLVDPGVGKAGRVQWVDISSDRDDRGEYLYSASGSFTEEYPIGALSVTRIVRVPCGWPARPLSIKYRLKIGTATGDYLEGGHTFDRDTNPNILSMDAWVDENTGRLWFSYIGDEDTKSILWIARPTVFSHGGNIDTIRTDFRTNGTFLAGRTSATDGGADGIDTGIVVSADAFMYIGILGINDLVPNVATTDQLGMVAAFKTLRYDRSRDPSARLIVGQEDIDIGSGEIVRKGIGQLYVRDPFGYTTSVEYRTKTAGNIGDDVAAPGSGPTTAWQIVTDSGQATFSVTAVNAGLKKFTVAEDLTEILFSGDTITISGSTGNDGTYTVSDVTGSVSSVITVSEVILDGTADGTIALPFPSVFEAKVNLSANGTSVLEFRINLIKGPPIPFFHTFDTDRDPELVNMTPYLSYDENTEKLILKVDYQWDEDVTEVRMLATVNQSALTLSTPGYIDARWDTLSSSDTVRLTSLARQGTFSYRSGDAAADGGSMTIKRGMLVYIYMIGISADGRRGDVHEDILHIEGYPVVEPEYIQAAYSQEGSAKIWIKDKDVYVSGAGMEYRIVSIDPLINVVWTAASYVADLATNVPYDGYFSVPSFNLHPKHLTVLEWRLYIKDSAVGPTVITGSHAFDFDQIPRVLPGTKGWRDENGRVFIQFALDEDGTGIAWNAGISASSLPSVLEPTQLTNNFAGTNLPNYYAGQEGTAQVYGINNTAATDWVKVVIMALGNVVYNDNEDLVDVIKRKFTIVIEPIAESIPGVTPRTTQSGQTGTMTLAVVDPQTRITGVYFKHKTIGIDAWSAETLVAVNGNGEYEYQRTDLSRTQNTKFEWRVVYTSMAGIARELRGDSVFDTDLSPEFKEYRMSIDALTNEPVFYYELDEDGDQISYATSVNASPGAFATTVGGQTGTITFTALEEGQVFYIRARAERASGSILGQIINDDTSLPSYTASPLGFNPISLKIANGKVFMSYVGGKSVAKVYYETGIVSPIAFDAADSGAQTITVNARDLTGAIRTGDTIEISGTTGNNGVKTVSSIAFSTDTVITLAAASLSDNTVGTLTALPPDPTTSSPSKLGQTAYFDTGLAIIDGEEGVVKVMGGDGEASETTGDILEIHIVNDANVVAEIKFFSVTILPVGTARLSVGTDDDTTDIYYAVSKTAMPSEVIDGSGTGDNTEYQTGGGSGIYTLSGYPVMKPGETLYIKFATYDGANFGPEYEYEKVWEVLPGFKSYTMFIDGDDDDVAVRTTGQPVVKYELNTAATQIKWGWAFGANPSNLTRVDSDGEISWADFQADTGEIANGIPEGKTLVVKMVAMDGSSNEGDPVFLVGRYEYGLLHAPSVVVDTSYPFYDQGKVTVTIHDRELRKPGPVFFSVRKGDAAGTVFAAGTEVQMGTRGTAGFPHIWSKQFTLDAEHESACDYKFDWLASDAKVMTLSAPAAFRRIARANILTAVLSTGEYDVVADTMEVFLSFEANIDTLSVKYGVSTGTPTATIVAPGRTGDFSVGSFALSDPDATPVTVSLVIKGYDQAAGAGNAGEEMTFALRMPSNPGRPKIRDGSLKAAYLSNPPFSASFSAAPKVGQESTHLTLNGTITIPKEQASDEIRSVSGDYEITAAGALVSTSVPSVVLGGDTTVAGSVIIAYVAPGDPITGDACFYVAAVSGGGAPILSAPYVYAASVKALFANIVELKIEDIIAIAPGGEFQIGNFTPGLETGIAITDTLIQGFDGGISQFSIQGSGDYAGRIMAGGVAVKIDASGIAVTTAKGDIKLFASGLDLPMGALDNNLVAGGSYLHWYGSSNAYLGAYYASGNNFVAGSHATLAFAAEEAYFNGVVVAEDGLRTGIVSTITSTNLNLKTQSDSYFVTFGPNDLVFPHVIAGNAGKVMRVNDAGTAIEWGSAGTATVLGSLSDVTITTPANDHILVRYGSLWVNVAGSTKFASNLHTLDSHAAGTLNVNRLSLPGGTSASYFLKADIATAPSWSVLSIANLSDFPTTFSPAAHTYDFHDGLVPIADITGGGTQGTLALISTNGVVSWGTAPVSSHSLSSHTGTLPISKITVSGIASRKFLSSTVDTVSWHTLVTSDITNFSTEINTIIGASSIYENKIVPSYNTYAAAAHTHAGYAEFDHTHAGYAPTSHAHLFSHLTNTIADLQVPAGAVTQHQALLEIAEGQIVPDYNTYAAVGHTHNAYAHFNHTHTGYAPTSHTLNSHAAGTLNVNRLSLPGGTSASYFLKADIDTAPSWSVLSIADLSDFPTTFSPAAHTYAIHNGLVPIAHITGGGTEGTLALISTNGVVSWGTAPVTSTPTPANDSVEAISAGWAHTHVNASNPHGITASTIGLGGVENRALSTWIGSENITRLGTIAIGTIPWGNLSNVPSFATTTDIAEYTGSNLVVTVGTITDGTIPWANVASKPTGVTGTVTVVTDVRVSGTTLQKKTRIFSHTDGVQTSYGTETGWTFAGNLL